MTIDLKEEIINIMKSYNTEKYNETIELFYIKHKEHITSQNFIKELEIILNKKDSDELDFALYIISIYGLLNEDFSLVLCKLLEENWHYKHEDIAFMLQELKSPKAVDSLYVAAITEYDYLSYSDAQPLAVKCIHALGDIGTPEAKYKLQLLLRYFSNNTAITDKITKQLLKFR